MRSAKLPLTFFKPPPSPSPSPSTSPSLPHSQSPKLHYPPLPKSPLKKKKKPSTQAPSPLAPPVASPIFQSPVLSDAMATFNSLSTAITEAGASLNLATLLRSFCCTSTSPTDALTLFRHISSCLSPNHTSFHVLLGHSCLQTPDGNNDDQLSHVFNVFDLMSTSGFNPNVVSANLAVDALCSAAHLDDACTLLHRLSSISSAAPILSDAFTYNFLIHRLTCVCPISSVYAFIDELCRSFSI